MTANYKHGDRIVWRYPNQHNSRIIVEKHGYFVRIVSGDNKEGKVWAKFEGNKTPTQVPQYELALE
jgi:hypothetical protein